jgi:cytochrome c5
MSANDHTTAHEEAHTGPIKTPQQLLAAVFFSFVVPIFAIIGLVYYVTSANKPLAGADDAERAVAQRIQKVGMVEIRDANRPLRSGEEVYKAQCIACHGTGAAGSPKFGDAAAWAPRISTGYDALLNSALKGKNAMAAQGGGDFQDVEIGRAVVYMTTAAGGKFAEPAVPAAAAGDAPAAAPAAVAAVTPVATPAAPAAATAPAAPATPVKVAAADSGAGEALYKQACFACHAAGVAGAPKFGDKAAWAPRIQTGLDALTNSAIKGKNAMPPKGGSAASDADIHSAVVYMVNAAK